MSPTCKVRDRTETNTPINWNFGTYNVIYYEESTHIWINTGKTMKVVVVYQPPACVVWQNHEVLDFQPRSVTTLILGSIAYFSNILFLPPLYSPATNILPSKGYSSSWTVHQHLPSRLSTGSSAHLGAPCLRPWILIPHRLFTGSSSHLRVTHLQ